MSRSNQAPRRIVYFLWINYRAENSFELFHLQPKKHAAQRYVIFDKAGQMLVSCFNHLVTPPPVEVLHLRHVGVEPVQAPLVEKTGGDHLGII